MPDVAALYVHKTGSYAGLDNVDMWDQERDARLYDGPHPVVAHPPCNTWCMLASVNEARWGKTIGDDGGCFAAALASVRQWGGVLEHPAYTLAWGHHDLHRPSRGYWGRSFTDDGWVTEISQVAYGHPARKRTWLYYVGANLPPALRWNEPEWEAVIGGGINTGQSQGSAKVTGYPSSETPPSFRDALLDMARTSALVAA